MKAVNLRPPRDDFFVSIPDPSHVQVPVLECRRDLLESMRIFSQLKNIRRQKGALKSRLRKQIAEITRHINSIRSSIPDVTLEEEMVPKQQAPEAKAKKPITDFAKIEQGLQDIEAKLAKLK
ncbi:hypothetical protein J4419_02720 [Candidatus Woesearchaeota archaeon]|nr:hypothetical protein [Candidatus Woesearchaeota archaeon]